MSVNLGQKIQDLYSSFGDLSGITIELHKQLIAVAVHNKSAKATLFLQGAQLAEYQRLGEEPVLWMSDQCDFKAGKSLRGGIPICWPWFGNLEFNPEAVKSQFSGEMPAHGFVREREWSLDRVNSVDEYTTELFLSLDVEPDPERPFCARLQLKVSIGQELELEFSVSNTGDKTFSFTSALHTYFSVSHIERAEIHGLEQKTYLDTLNGWQSKTDADDLQINSEVDRVYPDLNKSTVLKDSGWDRAIQIEAEHFPDMVVWNPWIDKAKRLSHFADEAYQEMICMESAQILDNYLTLKPEEQFKASIIIRSE
ncbi:D-hexose-6-phosphate mutarotase [Neptuniibacter sp.]|uniref:D-hexose-6-phosphate mutarotase n=1 Tax=Neptuniibacter sp. TaxID=1962643 RepID=UPI00263A29D5|nr:D-hexose-6-phosphate mutarotase [Neptuniibacter sp.]MCP4598898.1 D-hexose-6-phosphate mutarotase [Neptuniibacter sp.]